MLFITNRSIKQSERSRSGRAITLDLDGSGSAASVFYCERHGVGKYTEIMSDALMTRLSQHGCKEIILYIHGYNVLPEGNKGDGSSGAFKSAEILQSMLDKEVNGHFLVLPILWPTDDDPGMLKDYFDDRLVASASGSPYARVLGKFLLWRAHNQNAQGCLKRISVVCHSMGALVVESSLTKWAENHGVAPRVFRHLFMFAPDTPNEILQKTHPGRCLSDSSSTVSVYHAADDLAMRASKVLNLDRVVSRRLGHTGPEDMNNVPDNVFAIDCGDFNNSYDPLDGHSYFLNDNNNKPGAAFRHMLHTLRRNRPDKSGKVVVSQRHENRLILPENY